MPYRERLRPDITLGAPVGSVDLAAFDEDGNPYEIFACNQCLPWYAEVIVHPEDGDRVGVREWHAVDCPDFQELIGEGAEH